MQQEYEKVMVVLVMALCEDIDCPHIEEVSSLTTPKTGKTVLFKQCVFRKCPNTTVKFLEVNKGKYLKHRQGCPVPLECPNMAVFLFETEFEGIIRVGGMGHHKCFEKCCLQMEKGEASEKIIKTENDCN